MLNSLTLARGLDVQVDLQLPGSSTDYTLPSTGVRAGQRIVVMNGAANTAPYPIISIKSSSGALVRQVYPQTEGTVIALQDTPTTAAHWAGLGIVTSNWIDGGTSVVTASTSNPTKGTTSRDRTRWRREGNDLLYFFDYRQTSGGTAGTGTYLIGLPTGLVLDTSVMLDFNGGTKADVCGAAHASPGGATALVGTAFMWTSNQVSMTFIDPTTGTAIYTDCGSTFASLANVNQEMAFNIRIPINGWSATKG